VAFVEGGQEKGLKKKQGKKRNDDGKQLRKDQLPKKLPGGNQIGGKAAVL